MSSLMSLLKVWLILFSHHSHRKCTSITFPSINEGREGAGGMMRKEVGTTTGNQKYKQSIQLKK